jgi:hypothetical protein
MEETAMQIRVVRLFAASVALVLVAGGAARAGTKVEKCTVSGSGVSIPVDIDSDSCFTASNGATVCTDSSGYDNVSGKCSPGGRFTGQVLVEADPVSGSGCNIAGTTVPDIASCTLAGSSEQGCEFQAAGGSEVRRDTVSGDLTFFTFSTDSRLCADLTSGPPFNFTSRTKANITGGTGRNAGATGTEMGTGRGQILTSDAASHGLSWEQSSFTDTITTK